MTNPTKSSLETAPEKHYHEWVLSGDERIVKCASCDADYPIDNPAEKMAVNAALPTALKTLTRADLFFPNIGNEPKIITSISEIVGTFALWAIQQSPYPVPPNLELVCKTLDEKLMHSKTLGVIHDDGFRMVTIDAMPGMEVSVVKRIERSLEAALKDIPQYLAWNDRVNGNDAQFNFTSRHDGPSDPDNDFIDLSALVRNVAMTLVQRYIVDSRDGWLMTSDGPVKMEIKVAK